MMQVKRRPARFVAVLLHDEKRALRITSRHLKCRRVEADRSRLSKTIFVGTNFDASTC
jgi:hypothetical protein